MSVVHSWYVATAMEIVGIKDTRLSWRQSLVRKRLPYYETKFSKKLVWLIVIRIIAILIFETLFAFLDMFLVLHCTQCPRKTAATRGDIVCRINSIKTKESIRSFLLFPFRLLFMFWFLIIKWSFLNTIIGIEMSINFGCSWHFRYYMT